MHSEYILTYILEKFTYLWPDFNKLYEEGYVKFWSLKIRPFFIFKCIEILFDKPS